MESIGSLFTDYRVIVYENNSKDRTVFLLKRWQKLNSRLELITENLSNSELSQEIINHKLNGNFYHPELIARARNTVLDHIFSDRYEDFSHVIWMDMDFTFTPNLEGLVEAFETDRDWDAIFAYGIDPSNLYWDWYAFRDAAYPIGSELLGNTWWRIPKKLLLSQSDEWYPVYSAFGGCGIYKKASLENCRYSAVVTEDLKTLSEKLICKGIQESNPLVNLYLKSNQRLHSCIIIDSPTSDLPMITDSNIGIYLTDLKTPLIWRMSSFVYQYPSTCEHVALHASMIIRGRDKLFINPRFVFHYGS